MNAWDAGGMSRGGGIGDARLIPVDVYTSAYRVSGSIETRFGRITEILNQQTGGHLPVLRGTVREHADPPTALAVPTALVSVEEILVMVAEDMSGSSTEMRIPKRQVRAHLAIPPLRVTGTIHVPMGTRPADGLLHGVDPFIAMTDATIASGAHPQVGRTAPVLALRRRRAHVLLVADDENPDELLAEVLDERTAEAWLRADESVER
jgi:hypothetical protein